MTDTRPSWVPWTTERDDFLRGLWDQGLTGSQIAQKMQTTRCAILGRARRLRLPSRISVESKAFTAPRKKAPQASKPKFNFASQTTKATGIKQDGYVYRETIVTPEHERVSFGALNEFDKRCRYPHGDEPPFMFCGATVVPGQPWCPTHFQVCAPALAAKREAALQLSGKTGELEQLQNLQQLEAVS